MSRGYYANGTPPHGTWYGLSAARIPLGTGLMEELRGERLENDKDIRENLTASNKNGRPGIRDPSTLQVMHPAHLILS